MTQRHEKPKESRQTGPHPSEDSCLERHHPEGEAGLVRAWGAEHTQATEPARTSPAAASNTTQRRRPGCPPAGERANGAGVSHHKGTVRAPTSTWAALETWRPWIVRVCSRKTSRTATSIGTEGGLVLLRAPWRWRGAGGMRVTANGTGVLQEDPLDFDHGDGCTSL